MYTCLGSPSDFPNATGDPGGHEEMGSGGACLDGGGQAGCEDICRNMWGLRQQLVGATGSQQDAVTEPILRATHVGTACIRCGAIAMRHSGLCLLQITRLSQGQPSLNQGCLALRCCLQCDMDVAAEPWIGLPHIQPDSCGQSE